MEINLRDLAAVARVMEDRLTVNLLVWRDRMQAATNLPDGAFVFIIPPEALIGVAELAGSRVIHSADASRPMVAVSLPD